MIFKFALIQLLLMSFAVSAQVWEATNKWTPNAEKKYQTWVKDAVKKDIFTNPKSHYYHIDTDCADMIYSLRAIFAYENQLPFQIKNTMGGAPTYFSHKNKYTPSRADRADDFVDRLDPDTRDALTPEKIESLKRLRVFLNFINRNIADTYGLAFRDTLPVDPKKVAPGDIYVSPVKTDRHSYMIKDVSTLGHFHLLYDTLMVQIADLFLLKGLPKYAPNGYGWGMKRFVSPGHQYIVSQVQNKDQNVNDAKTQSKENRLKEQMKFWGFSFEQYKHLKDKDFFAIFFKDLKLAKEPIDLEIKRKVQNICTHLYQRNIVVDDALELLKLKNTTAGQKYFDQKGCFKPDIYRKLSTPSRDAGTMAEIESLYETWARFVKENPDKRYSSDPYSNLVPWFIFNDYVENENWDYELSDIPKATVRLEQKIMTDSDSTNPCNQLESGSDTFRVSNFIYRYRNQQIGTNTKGQEVWISSLSSNPNDIEEGRWGHDEYQERSQCINYDEPGELVRPL